MLGVLVDSEGNWMEHCDALAKKLSTKVYLLRAIKSLVEDKVLKSVYWACFNSEMTYCILCWGHSPSAKKVFKMQRKAIRVLAGLRYRDDCKSAFKSLRILTLPSIYILQSLMFTRRNMTNFKTQGCKHSYNTRGADLLEVPFRRLTTSRNSVAFWGIRFFNSLPSRIKELPLKTFKTVMKSLLVQSAFYSYEEFLTCPFGVDMLPLIDFC